MSRVNEREFNNKLQAVLEWLEEKYPAGERAHWAYYMNYLGIMHDGAGFDTKIYVYGDTKTQRYCTLCSIMDTLLI